MRIPSVDKTDSLAVSLGIFLIAGLFLTTTTPLQSTGVKRDTTLANVP